MKRFICFLFLIASFSAHAEARKVHSLPVEVLQSPPDRGEEATAYITNPKTGDVLYKVILSLPKTIFPVPKGDSEIILRLLDQVEALRRENDSLRAKIQEAGK